MWQSRKKTKPCALGTWFDRGALPADIAARVQQSGRTSQRGTPAHLPQHLGGAAARFSCALDGARRHRAADRPFYLCHRHYRSSPLGDHPLGPHRCGPDLFLVLCQASQGRDRYYYPHSSWFDRSTATTAPVAWAMEEPERAKERFEAGSGRGQGRGSHAAA